MNSCATCFYFENFPEGTNNLDDNEKCACLTNIPNKACTFYIPKDEYEWGVNKYGAPAPVKK